MARWAWIAVDTDGTARGELTEARSRRLTVPLDGPVTASFAIDGRHEQATLLDELSADLVVRRGDRKLYRGRVGRSSDNISANVHTVSFESADYRGLLGRRVLYAGDTLTFAAVDQEQIGWTLIANTQARTGGDLGITRGASQSTGVTRDRTYPAGKNIGDALTQLGRVDNGFDWEIDPDLVYRVHYPTRGRLRSNFPLEYGGSVASLSRNVNPSRFANAVRVTGDDALVAESREAAGLATAAEGRFDVQWGDPDITEQTTLAAKADWLLDEHFEVRPAYTVTLAPDVWSSPTDLWVGDTAPLIVKTGRLAVVTELRVYELQFDIDDSGVETITAVLGDVPPHLATELSDTSRRLTDLERR